MLSKLIFTVRCDAQCGQVMGAPTEKSIEEDRGRIQARRWASSMSFLTNDSASSSSAVTCGHC